MRKKELKLVITFHTTSDAMKMEKSCKEKGIAGRLIPVPREISAGCGLSWATDLEAEKQLEEVMKEVGIERQDIHQCMV